MISFGTRSSKLIPRTIAPTVMPSANVALVSRPEDQSDVETSEQGASRGAGSKHGKGCLMATNCRSAAFPVALRTRESDDGRTDHL
jgi:hypothetical protein